MFSKGADISLWNHVTSWEDAKAAGLQWISIKASQRDYSDPKAVVHVRGARAAGIPIMPYHYLTDERSGEEQYEAFRGSIEACGGWAGMLVPALDVEGNSNNRIKVSSSEYLDIAEAWCRCLKKEIGRDAVIYTYPSFNNEHGVGKRLGDHPLWAASYREGSPAKFSGWDTWTFWQYDDHGSIRGLGGGLDVNWYNGTLEDLIAKFSVVQPKDIRIVGPDSKVIECGPRFERDGRITVEGLPLLRALGLPEGDPAVHASGRAYLRELEHSPWVFYYRDMPQGPRVYIKKKRA
jgi:lysozyme